jgi:GTP cyclohydrolase I
MSTQNRALDNTNTLPDIANEPHTGPNGRLNWVGMSEIEMPIRTLNGNGDQMQTVGRIQAYVNLTDPESKGIHMSRLYLTVDQMLGNEIMTPALLNAVVKQFLVTHDGISDNAYLECRFEFMERRKALISNNTGWKGYKVRAITSIKAGEINTELGIEVPYSSTCPCSAALARDIIQQGFLAEFGDSDQVSMKDVHQWLGTKEGISATPHSQRSIAQVRVKLSPEVEDLPISRLIDSIEDALKTPVQAAVKREDEQEFARLNGQNLMFCEDAARRLHQQLNRDNSLSDFWIRVNHMESLHPHDAVAIVVKGLDNGYRDDPREFPH